MKVAGPPGASSNGFNENLALFNSGTVRMWIDATVAASMVDQSQGFQGCRQGRLALAPMRSARRQLAVGREILPFPRLKKVAAAEKFIAWATNKDYTKLVATKEGWANVRPARELRCIRILISEGCSVRIK